MKSCFGSLKIRVEYIEVMSTDFTKPSGVNVKQVEFCFCSCNYLCLDCYCVSFISLFHLLILPQSASLCYAHSQLYQPRCVQHLVSPVLYFQVLSSSTSAVLFGFIVMWLVVSSWLFLSFIFCSVSFLFYSCKINVFSKFFVSIYIMGSNLVVTY